MKKLFIFAILVLFAVACDNNVNLVGNDDPIIPDNKEEQDEAQDETSDETVDEQVQDDTPDESEDETIDTDVVWDNCSETYECEGDELCVKDIGDCNGWGICEKIPGNCDSDYEPVCGCDNVTYTNSCEAQKLLRNAKYSGECEQLRPLPHSFF